MILLLTKVENVPYRSALALDHIERSRLSLSNKLINLAVAEFGRYYCCQLHIDHEDSQYTKAKFFATAFLILMSLLMSSLFFLIFYFHLFFFVFCFTHSV